MDLNKCLLWPTPWNVSNMLISMFINMQAAIVFVKLMLVAIQQVSYAKLWKQVLSFSYKLEHSTNELCGCLYNDGNKVGAFPKG